MGFDFGNFETVDETPEIQATTGGDQDDWGTGFTASGKKGKKNKKSALEDASNHNDSTGIGTAVTEPAVAEDAWSAWDTPGSKKDKNKKKKNDPDPVANDVPPMPPPPPPPPSEPPADDAWSAFGTKTRRARKVL